MRLIAVGVLFVTLAGCGDDDPAPVDASSLADELDCASLEPEESEELYVRELFTCERDGETTSVYTFNTSSARDSWLEVAEEFGAVVVAEGDTWLEVE